MTNQEIKNVGQTIAQETQIGGNTAARVGGVVEGIGVALDNKDAANGYYQATISGGTITVNAPNYLLGSGGNLRIKMPSAGTTASTLTIGNANAVQLWYNGSAVSAQNTWEANEIISVFYDGTRFMASNSQGGGKFSTGEKVRETGITNEITENSDELPTSDAVYRDTINRPKSVDSSLDGDYGISDESGNVIVKFKGGHILTKNFNSEMFHNMEYVDYEDCDFAISDIDGNAIAIFKDGNILVKNFLPTLYGKNVSFLGDSITTFGNYAGSNNPYYTGSNAGVTSIDKTWWGRLCKKSGAIVNRIYANGGKTVGFLAQHYNELFSAGTTGTPPDYIFILCGINDFGQSTPLGTIEDVEAYDTTFYAAYKYLLKNLITTYPNAKIFGITMLNSMRRTQVVPYEYNGIRLRDMCDAIIECCKLYAVEYIDLNRLVNINANNYTSVLDDLTHPNSIGMELMSSAIMKSLINK